MIRSIDFPCDRRWIKNPTNSPLATPGARKGAAALTKLCIVTIGLMLDAHFKAPTAWCPSHAGSMQANRWTVTLTRISMGTLDPITGGASMKAVQDAIALWCGVKNERDPVWHWIEPIRQEKRGKGYFGVRIVIEDLAPGEVPPVTLKSIERFEWMAKQRIKEAKMYKDGAIKKAGRVLTYQPEAGARAASSAARSKADAAFARLQRTTGKGVEPARPTALDLRDAAERVLDPRTAVARRALDKAREKVNRDPGEERHARDLAPCTTCGVGTGVRCDEAVPGPRAFGVHVARAKAAGVASFERQRQQRAPTNGHRRVVPPAQAPLPLPAAYTRLPWERTTCAECSGKGYFAITGRRESEPRCGVCHATGFRGPVRRAKWPDGNTPLDGPDAPMTTPITVPADHSARFGDRVTLTRRRTTLPKIGDVWLYE